ncbi:MAG: hypothetical protein WBN72_02980 [Nitrososphaeraceae archaeon]
MKTKWVEKTQDSQIVAVVELTDQEILFLNEVVRMYDDKRLADLDDKNIDKVKKGLMLELHEAFKQVRPS